MATHTSALDATSRAPAPVRLAHLGLGNFFRAHQAWYTQHADDGHAWGYAAFSGRSRDLVDRLGAQAGAYTLITRHPTEDRHTVIDRLSEVHAGTDIRSWLATVASPPVAAITLTVTESAYLVDAIEHPGSHHALGSDIAALRTLCSGGPSADQRRAHSAAPPEIDTVPGRLAAGLLERRRLGGGALALVPCDNLPDNGDLLRRIVRGVIAETDPSAVPWLDEHVSFVTTMIDRITPAATEQDEQDVADATGWRDAAPVVTEPFTDWVLAGDFPAGRPAWETAGATLTDDVRPYERRKLWLLNGAHSLLAYAGLSRGHTTVADALEDPGVRAWVERWWDTAGRHLDFTDTDLHTYCTALLDRFANPRMAHRLGAIAVDGSQKLPVRVLPVLRAELTAGRSATAATTILGAWLAHLRAGRDVTDVQAASLGQLVQGPLETVAPRLLRWLDPTLEGAEAAAAAIAGSAQELEHDR